MTEEKLIARAQTGDINAFRQLVRQTQQSLYHFAYDLTGNHHDAEDLSQEVYLRMHRHLHKFRGDAKVTSWLFRIAVNTNISKHRKKAFKALTFVETMDDGSISTGRSSSAWETNPEKHAERSIMQSHIQSALQSLSLRERSVFSLRHYRDLPLKEIAAIMGITEGTVKSTLFRSIRKLQKRLEDYREEIGTETGGIS